MRVLKSFVIQIQFYRLEKITLSSMYNVGLYTQISVYSFFDLIKQVLYVKLPFLLILYLEQLIIFLQDYNE